MQVSVRLGRETGVDLFGKPRRNVFVNDLGQKVVYVFHHSVIYSPKSWIKVRPRTLSGARAPFRVP